MWVMARGTFDVVDVRAVRIVQADLIALVCRQIRFGKPPDGCYLSHSIRIVEGLLKLEIISGHPHRDGMVVRQNPREIRKRAHPPGPSGIITCVISRAAGKTASSGCARPIPAV